MTKKSIRISVTLCLLLSLIGCGGESDYRIKEQDKIFVSKIKNNLKKKGDTARVADIHPGNWEAVCINPISAYSNIEVNYVDGVGPRPNGIEVLNNPVSTYANERVWGIYFRYSENQAEYYRIPIEEIQGHISNPNHQSWERDPNCIPRDFAFIEVVDDRGKWGENTPPSISKDFIDISIIDERVKK